MVSSIHTGNFIFNRMIGLLKQKTTDDFWSNGVRMSNVFPLSVICVYKTVITHTFQLKNVF